MAPRKKVQKIRAARTEVLVQENATGHEKASGFPGPPSTMKIVCPPNLKRAEIMRDLQQSIIEHVPDAVTLCCGI